MPFYRGDGVSLTAYLLTGAGLVQIGPPGTGGGGPSDPDADVNLGTYVYKDATNTGLARLGLTEADLTVYTGPGGFAGTQTVVFEDQIINDDIRIYDSANVILRRCKLNGHVDCDSATASFLAEDCDLNAGMWNNANIGFRNITVRRCNISGGITSVSGNQNTLVEDCFCHGLWVQPGSDAHTGTITNFGGSNLVVRRTTIQNDSVDNGTGGGPTGCFQLIADFAPISDILVEYCWLPATEGGYTASLGYNPGKPHGGNPTGIVFRHNIFGRRPENGKGGVFGTVTSWLPDAGDGVIGTGNLYYDNLWRDTGDPVAPNT